jgi:hypothetical protein
MVASQPQLTLVATNEEPAKNRQQFAEEFNGLYREAENATMPRVIEMGQVLIDARKSLGHGEYEAMVKSDLLVETSTARRWVLITKHSLMSNRAHAHVLPPSWRTLYELTLRTDP